MGETCGAVTGAFMVIGLKYGTVTNRIGPFPCQGEGSSFRHVIAKPRSGCGNLSPLVYNS